MIDADRIASAKAALDDMDDFARMDTGINAIGARTYLEQFIADVEKELAAKEKSNGQ